MSSDTGMITVLASKELEEINTTKVNHVFQELGPSTRRFDTISPSNGSGGVNTDAFLYQTGKDFLNLRQLKRDILQVDFTFDTAYYNTAPFSGFQPTILSDSNWTCDNFCLSKAINEIVMKWGSSELREQSETRTPFLTEVKTSFFDSDACNRYGQTPLAFDGYGSLQNVIANPPFKRNEINTVDRAQLDNVWPLHTPQGVRDAEATKIIKNAK